MQETATSQQSEQNKVTTTFKCSPAIRAQLQAKAAQLDITLSALCEDYIMAGLSSATQAASGEKAPTEKPERTLTDTDLRLIHSEVEQAILNYEASEQDDTEAEETPAQDTGGAAPVLALKLTKAQRQVIDQVNEFRTGKGLPVLEDSATEVLTGYGKDFYDRNKFEKTNGQTFAAFKKAMNEQEAAPEATEAPTKKEKPVI